VFAVGPDLHFLAGFVAGEGHFRIGENNAGQSWSCLFDLRQRDDNAELVAAVHELVGDGRLVWVPPRGTSHAQVSWRIESMTGCSNLAAALGQVPLLGKKSGDFAIWRRAVTIWTDRRLGSARWPRMRQLASLLRGHRDAGRVPDYTRVDISRSALSSFLAGFASAEGHFGASVDGHPRFTIKLRADDTAVLWLLAQRFGVGRLVSAPASTRGRAQTAWLVTGLEELRVLVAVFDAHRPLGRAARVYHYWRELVTARDRRGGTLPPLAAHIRDARRYRTPDALPTTMPRAMSKRDSYVGVLRSWARATAPPYTATSYERWRASAAASPTRNTLATFFGSWHAALTAAGLPTGGIRPQETNAKASASAAPARALAASRRRDEVLRAVDGCWAALGRVPTASEFFSYRLRETPESPSQPEVYRLFPGGWAAVLEALPPHELT
jgi:LAGLIDADG DNA endonuclease family protein